MKIPPAIQVFLVAFVATVGVFALYNGIQFHGNTTPQLQVKDKLPSISGTEAMARMNTWTREHPYQVFSYTVADANGRLIQSNYYLLAGAKASPGLPLCASETTYARPCQYRVILYQNEKGRQIAYFPLTRKLVFATTDSLSDIGIGKAFGPSKLKWNTGNAAEISIENNQRGYQVTMTTDIKSSSFAGSSVLSHLESINSDTSVALQFAFLPDGQVVGLRSFYGDFIELSTKVAYQSFDKQDATASIKSLMSQIPADLKIEDQASFSDACQEEIETAKRELNNNI